MAEYWYDESSSKAKVEEIKGQYNKIITVCQNLASTMKEYVCVNNKWYDENAVMVAKWWNQSTDGKTSGRN